MTQLIRPSEKIILALDGMDKDQSIALLDKLPDLLWVKIGLELFVSAGPTLVNDLREKGKKVFLDLKFHDIPSTMAKACRQATKTGAELITVHACSGIDALLEANNSVIETSVEMGCSPPTLLAVTVLTSWTSSQLSKELLVGHSIDERVEHMAEMAFRAGIGGCICSPLEVSKLRSNYPFPFELVTPGIRLPGDNLDDQGRVMTPSQAMKNGASRLVIGRTITSAQDPKLKFDLICNQLISDA